MIHIGPNRVRVLDLSNPPVSYRRQVSKSRTHSVDTKQGTRSSNMIFFSAMSIPQARKLEINDPVSVIGSDGQRHVGTVLKSYHGMKIVWLDVAYSTRIGEIPVVERFRSAKNMRKMERLVYPTNRKGMNF